MGIATIFVIRADTKRALSRLGMSAQRKPWQQPGRTGGCERQFLGRPWSRFQANSQWLLIGSSRSETAHLLADTLARSPAEAPALPLNENGASSTEPYQLFPECLAMPYLEQGVHLEHPLLFLR